MHTSNLTYLCVLIIEISFIQDAQELASILSSPHVDNLLDAHDQVALMTLRHQEQPQPDRLPRVGPTMQPRSDKVIVAAGQPHQQQPQQKQQQHKPAGIISAGGRRPQQQQRETSSEESASEDESYDKTRRQGHPKGKGDDTSSSSSSSTENDQESSVDSLADKPIKVVGVRKIDGEPLVSLCVLMCTIYTVVRISSSV